jgi:hypothetical protein
MGMVNMDESFDEVPRSGGILERSNSFSTGEAEIAWKWKIRK